MVEVNFQCFDSMLSKNFSKLSPLHEISNPIFFAKKIGFDISCIGDSLYEMSNPIFQKKKKKKKRMS